jgi:hypothetical protein
MASAGGQRLRPGLTGQRRRPRLRRNPRSTVSRIKLSGFNANVCATVLKVKHWQFNY